MTITVRSPFAAPRLDSRAFNRVMTASFGVHIGLVVLLLVLPRDWWSKPTVRPDLITITLGGSASQRTTGTTQLGARPVEEVAPQPKRPEPVKQAASKPVPSTATVQTPVKPPPKPTQASPAQVTKPPTTGKEVVKGSSAAEMGGQGQNTGLAVTSGSGAAEELNVATFCCPDYLSEMARRIESRWRKDQQERGLTIVKFTIQKNGTIADIVLDQASGSGVLDREALFALRQTTLPPLPAEYSHDKLIVHLRFPYGVK